MVSSRLAFAGSCFFQEETVPKPPLIKDAACEPIADGACEPIVDATSICPVPDTDLVPALAEHSFRGAPSNHRLVKFAVDKFLLNTRVAKKEPALRAGLRVQEKPWLGELVMLLQAAWQQMLTQRQNRIVA
mmetsp:Transcript_13009/g.24991  ORF Transcript_13009/g.24991 Transcript_13009/m.24991 type:complete len:131 (-) Transcript_13009:3-395(-)